MTAETEKTADEVKAKGKAKAEKPEPQAQLTRAKVTRGSRRRIERAAADFDAAIDAAIEEFNRQAFIGDEGGKRVGDWPLVEKLRAIKVGVTAEINALFAQE